MTDTNWAKILGELLADHEISFNKQIPNMVAEAYTRTIVPPELSEQIKSAIHLLHESPPIEHRNAPPRSASPLPPPRPSRIERNENGGYTMIYDEPTA